MCLRGGGRFRFFGRCSFAFPSFFFRPTLHAQMSMAFEAKPVLADDKLLRELAR